MGNNRVMGKNNRDMTLKESSNWGYDSKNESMKKKNLPIYVYEHFLKVNSLNLHSISCPHLFQRESGLSLSCSPVSVSTAPWGKVVSLTVGLILQDRDRS